MYWNCNADLQWFQKLSISRKKAEINVSNIQCLLHKCSANSENVERTTVYLSIEIKEAKKLIKEEKITLIS